MKTLIKINELQEIISDLKSQKISIEKACEVITQLAESRIFGSDEKEDFTVECAVCKQRYKNHVGSTECCGSIAYLIEDGKATKKITLFARVNGSDIKPTIIDVEE